MDWDQHYRQVSSAGSIASVLKAGLHLARPGGEALDLACGAGANALHLAAAGFRVHAWDRSAEAIARLRQFAAAAGLEVDAVVRDAAEIVDHRDTFDLVLVSRFLDRELCPAIAAALKPSGLLFYQTHTRHRPPGAAGPSNPAYLLADNELLELFAGLKVRGYHDPDLAGDLAQGERGTAWLIAQKPA